MSLKAFMRSHLDNLQTQLFTQLPAVVTDVSKYQSQNIISVKPVIDFLFSDGQVSECPEIFNVPVINPSAGGGLLSFPIQVGDTVLVEFSMRSIETWLESSGESVTEPTMRTHDMSDGMAIIGLYTKSSHLSPDPKDVVLKFKDNSIRLKDDGNVEIITKSKYSVTNDAEELIAVLSDALAEIAASNVNTVYGISPLNNKAQILSIKSRLDSFKK
jgi:hypothetical protein